MVHLSVNVDYVAVIRESRKTDEPDPVFAAGIVEIAGAHGITAHLREDRRHIVDRDIRILREVVRLPFNLEMAGTDEMIAIASDIVPDQVTFVPEKRQEITTEGGLDVINNREKLMLGAQCVEIHTGEYANAKRPAEVDKHVNNIRKAAVFAGECGLEVHAGHGLTYKNISPVTLIREITGFYIGHSIMARAVYVGLDKAVRDMIALLNKERG